MSADTRGIRELAKEALHNSCIECLGYPECDGELPGEPHADECPAKGAKPPKPVDIMTAFAESIVEQCCKDVCEACRDERWQSPVMEPSGRWTHWAKPNEGLVSYKCEAAAIRSRWQRGEGK